MSVILSNTFHFLETIKKQHSYLSMNLFLRYALLQQNDRIKGKFNLKTRRTEIRKNKNYSGIRLFNSEGITKDSLKSYSILFHLFF